MLKSLTSRVLPKIRRFDTCHLRSILCGSFGLRMQSHTTAQDLEERANGTQVLESGLESLWALVLATACALVWVLVSGTQANQRMEIPQARLCVATLHNAACQRWNDFDF